VIEPSLAKVIALGYSPGTMTNDTGQALALGLIHLLLRGLPGAPAS
jgi:hypothetical protein